ncbi:MAG: hypothetical protein ACXW5U_05470 [Thermoanaerobaculia bacterium]
MKSALIYVFAVLLIGCGTGEDANHASASASGSSPEEVLQDTSGAAQTPPAQGEVTDEKIGLPAYPGAREVEYSRVKLHTDIGDTFSVSYQTSDSPAQVAAFYQTEAAKLGTLQEQPSTSDQLKSVSVNRTDGSQSAIKAMTDRKGATIISIHRFFPAK